MMQWPTKLVSLILITALLVSACDSISGDDSTEEPAPPEAAAATVVAELPSSNGSQLSVRIDTVRLAPDAKVDTIHLSSLTLIPVRAEGEPDTAKLIYGENELFIISNEQSYTPTSPWFISAEREDLAGEDFGIWFIVTGASVNAPPEGDWQLIRNEFIGLLKDAAPAIAGGLAALALAYFTPGIPDESVAGGFAANRGPTLMGHLSALGRQGLPQLLGPSRRLAGDQVRTQVENLIESLDNQQYIGEAYIRFSIDENYTIR